MVKGLKEIKKAAKLILKKQKVESKIKQLSKQYADLVNPNTITDEYFTAMVEDYLKRQE